MTVLLSTTRPDIVTKHEVLQMFCLEYGMKRNTGKVKFFVINGDLKDKEPLYVTNVIVIYMYMLVFLLRGTDRFRCQ